MKKLFHCIAILFPFLLIAQDLPKCGHELYMDYQEKSNPNYKQSVNEAFIIAKSWADANRRASSQDSLLHLPVVVHVLYENDNENISDNVIKSQIEVLNEDYRRLNSDSVDTRAVFDSLAGRGNFKFILATTDPQGNPTNGITRTSTTEASFMDQNFTMDLMKSSSTGGVEGWPNKDYINIWVCDISINGQVALLGYATPPNNLPNWSGGGEPPTSPQHDGVVIHYEVFGRDAVANLGSPVPFLGRVVTHEMGHYLGLRHSWGDGLCDMDDGIDDTPLANSESQNDCNHDKNSCVDSPYDYPDMVENYMDYSLPSCQNMFTKGQFDLMHGVLANNRVDLPVNNNVSVNKYGSLDLKLFPNPTKNSLTIEISKVKVNSKLQLFNVSGQLIWEKELSQKANQRIHLHTNNFTSGIYLLQYQSDSFILKAKKVILN